MLSAIVYGEVRVEYSRVLFVGQEDMSSYYVRVKELFTNPNIEIRILDGDTLKLEKTIFKGVGIESSLEELTRSLIHLKGNTVSVKFLESEK